MSHAHPARKLLLPLVPAYRFALALRELRLRSGIERVRRLRFPVISVGSLSAGGAGKTPLTIALAKLLSREGFCVDVLSRGYGRQNPQPARVRVDGTAEDFGDEPLLIARETGVPVYVAARRYQAGLLAEKDAAQQNQPAASGRLHLLDDGFQHRELARDADIVLINSHDWRDSLLPAGNLREPLSAIRRAGVLAIPADEPELELALKAWGWNGPIWRLRRKIDLPRVAGPVAAFCGIARPEQFFHGLESAGLRLAVRTTFPDHHRYSAREIDRLLSTARAAGAAALITTEKDEVRLGKFISKIAAAFPLLTACLRIEFERESEVVKWLRTRLG